MDLIQKLNWRYATKRMNGTQVPREKLDTILQAILLTPSSFGLQPYQVIVVENKEMRTKLQKAAFNQPQLLEGSHLLVFAAFENITQQRIDDFITLNSMVKGIPVEKLAEFKNRLAGSLLSRTPEVNFNWAARQAYIALGIGLAAAAHEQVDATPMEGFIPGEFDSILGLKEKGLKSVVLLTLGYRDEANDPLSHSPKVRKAWNDFFIHVN